MSAILSFLGGSAFRLIWNQISEAWTKSQDQKYELQRMELQRKMDGEQHARNLESLRLQSELGVKEVRVQGEQRIGAIEMEGWAHAVASAAKPTGIWLIDLLNGLVRPAAAGFALFLWVYAMNAQGYQMTDWDRELVGVILGFYFATRIIQKRES